MKATNEKISVNTSEVDSIGGAKPEPEERPAFLTANVEGGKDAELREGALKLELPKLVRIEDNVFEMSQRLGKHCRNCARFNHMAGQAEIERRGYRGTEQERASIRELFATFEENHDAGGPIIADNESIFEPTPGEVGLGSMGQCNELKGLVHPDCHCAGPTEGKGDLWRPATSDIARAVQEMHDNFMGTAAGTIAGVPA